MWAAQRPWDSYRYLEAESSTIPGKKPRFAVGSRAGRAGLPTCLGTDMTSSWAPKAWIRAAGLDVFPGEFQSGFSCHDLICTLVDAMHILFSIACWKCAIHFVCLFPTYLFLIYKESWEATLSLRRHLGLKSKFDIVKDCVDFWSWTEYILYEKWLKLWGP